ncbi:MAG: Wzz/FepE/Etk N-terminal domain-containing protein, partial [Bacteroidota bacterium]
MNKDEMDMIGLLKVVWGGKRTIIILTVASTLFGVFIYLISPNEYMVKSDMVVPGSQNGAGSRLGRIAALTNFSLNLGGSSSLIRPSLYPEIIQSV